MVFTIGYSHPVVVAESDGIKLDCPNQTTVVVSGCDKQRVGQVAAEIRGKSRVVLALTRSLHDGRGDFPRLCVGIAGVFLFFYLPLIQALFHQQTGTGHRCNVLGITQTSHVA